MQLYFFNLKEDSLYADPEGRLAPTLEAAIDYATKEARCLVAADILSSGRLAASHQIEITDERGEVLHTVRFGDVVQMVH